MGGIKKAFKSITRGVGKLLGGGGSDGGTVEISAPAVSPTDITGQYSGSEDISDKAVTKKKRAGKRSLSVSIGETPSGTTKGLNVV